MSVLLQNRRIIVIAFIILSLLLALDWLRFIRQPLITNPNGLAYNYQPGSTVATLVDDLQARGFCSHPLYFRIYARLAGLSRQLQAGEYYFPRGTTIGSMLTTLAEGKVVQHELTLIEGWNMSDVLHAVASNPYLKHTLGISPQLTVATALGIEQSNPEGWFFPDTYHFPAGITDIEFLKRAHQVMQTKLASWWRQRDDDLPYYDAYSALIVASLIEKETKLESERPLVAGVITARLQAHMPLQIDPSVRYAVDPAGKFVLSKQDLQIDSPYNTYRHRGLPPTPIALPSAASIQAALHPARNHFLYFVAQHDGSHYFSKTLAEHNKAVARYRHRSS